jgi:hypothetical protein
MRVKHFTRPLLLACCLLAAGCRDSLAPEDHGNIPPSIQPLPTGGRTLAEYDCEVTVQTGSVDCRERGPQSGASLAILGLTQIKLSSSNVRYDSATSIFSMDVTVQNLLTPDSVGTPDGVRVTGVKVFYDVPPRITAYSAPYDTGTVRVHNADGVGHFNKPDQSYHFYNQMLAPQQVSAPVHWEIFSTHSVKTFSLSMRIFTARTREIPVPVAAPDTIPSWVYAAASSDTTAPMTSGRVVRNVARILFNPTATPEERQAAVDAVRGTVIGGTRALGSDGHYFVRLPTDATWTTLSSSLTLLDALPQVAFAGPELVFDEQELLAWVRPQDGLGWQKVDWRTHPDSANLANWGLEAIQAPQAWGCTTGSLNTRVAVVDGGFPTLNDFSDNVAYGSGLGLSTGVDDSHGSSVASVIAARGNNGERMTGVMWNADLHLYDFRARAPSLRGRLIGTSQVSENLGAAILSGARVVNLSWQLTGTHVGQSTFTTRERRQAEITADDLAMVTEIIGQTSGRWPLIVVAAGNYDMDAAYAGFPLLAERLPDQTLVVGAAQLFDPSFGAGSFSRAVEYSPTHADGGPWGTNYGPLVQIAAPGEQVGVIRGDGEVGLIDGTSFAAPYVTGAAGLLFSFDPDLTAAEAKQLLLDGAAAGGRSVINPNGSPATVNMLNVRKSLELAARRPGAPLCGNPVWQDTTGVAHALRGTDWSGPAQTLFAWPANTNDVFAPIHGGRYAMVGAQRFDYQPDASWSLGSPALADDNATSRSVLARSHDGDTTVTVTKRAGANPRYDEVFDISINGVPLVSIADAPKIDNMPAVNRCVAWATTGTEWDSCVSEYPVYRRRISSYSVAYSSARQEIALSVSIDSLNSAIETPFYYHSGFYRRNYSFNRFYHETHTIFIPVKDPGTRRALVTQGLRVSGIGYSDDGTHLLMRRRVFNSLSITTPETTTSSNSSACWVEFRRLGPEVPALTVAEVYQTPSTRQANCYNQSSFAP